MKKTHLLLLFAFVCFAGKSLAQTTYIQPCGTDEMAKKFKLANPQIVVYEKQLEDQIQQYIAAKRHGGNAAYKTTATNPHISDTDYYDIPVVVHVNHNDGPELIADAKIYALIAEMNRFYSLQTDTSAVIKPFKKYVGKAKMRFHLAGKDPVGNPTNGITHHLTYLTYGHDEQAKIDQWPPTSYVNIWFDYVIGEQVSNGVIVAYATQPPTAAANPYSDGIISNYSFINDTVGGGGGGGSIDHEMGHILNLYHTFGHTNNPHTNTSGNCSDDDGVDDTPPTEGNLGGCSLYDTVCATNYFKLYTNITGGDSLVNYPDTSNEQNIMNYADCKAMFTKGQVERMRAALNNTTAGRMNLWQPANLIATGVWDTGYNVIPHADLKPNPEFNITPGVGGNTTSANYMDRVSYFTCPGTTVTFHNDTWNDTLSSLLWTFSNEATTPTATATTTVANAFATPGWASVTMKATGNHSGDTTATFPQAIFVADATGTPGASVFQDFAPGTTDKWPFFNYYNNEFKWQLANVGMYDNYSMEYVGYDSRIVINPSVVSYPNTGTPLGDFDDLFSIPVDLSGFTAGQCSLNFDYSGASRSSVTASINDEMDIDYSIDGAKNWTNLVKLKKGALDNKGAVAVAYVPTSISDWSHKSIDIPVAAKTSYTVFRFRYKPSIGQDSIYSSGNNFFLDRINFRPFAAAVGNVVLDNADMAVVPNPTSGDAFIVMKDAANTVAKVIVTDITGKVVYTTSEAITSNEAQIQIPHSAISIPGMYLVQVSTGAVAHTQKLVVY